MDIQGKKEQSLDPTIWNLGVFRPQQSGCSASATVFCWLGPFSDLLLAFVSDIWSWWTQHIIFLCLISGSLFAQPLLGCRLCQFLIWSLGPVTPPQQVRVSWEPRKGWEIIPDSIYLWSYFSTLVTIMFHLTEAQSPFHSHLSLVSQMENWTRPPCSQLPYQTDWHIHS